MEIDDFIKKVNHLKKELKAARLSERKLGEMNFWLEKDNRALKDKLHLTTGGYGECEKCRTRSVVFNSNFNPVEPSNEDNES